MTFPHVKPEGGSGGKRGHSNMEHWQPTAEVKEEARKARRVMDKVTTNDWDDLERQLDRTDAEIRAAAQAVARLSEPIPEDYEPRDPMPSGIPCERCGQILELDVMLHPTESGALIGVARGFKPHECKP